jgi:hypothetical protein
MEGCDGEKGKTPPMQRLMPDSNSPGAERHVQPPFRKSWLFSVLLMIALVLSAHGLFLTPTPRHPGPPVQAGVKYRVDRSVRGSVGAFRIAGSWTVGVDDARFGGVSGLALDGDRLVALTDSGVVFYLPRPGMGSSAEIRDLPDGPGDPQFKRHRDSEALTADPAGRGWWVAFENRHSLWLYDHAFTKRLRSISLRPLGMSANRGIEGMVGASDQLLLFRERGSFIPVGSSVSDATRGPDGEIWLTTRAFGPSGVINRLGRFAHGRAVDAAVLPLGPLDNVEGLAVEADGPGGVRLWLMTDNDFSARRPTRLIALETP